MDEQSAPEEAAELALDEARQPLPAGARRGGGEERLQVLLHHAVQDRLGRGARDVGSHGAGPSGFRAVAATAPQDARTHIEARPGVGLQQPAQPSVARTRHRNRSL
jgi:hypothetical protein